LSLQEKGFDPVDMLRAMRVLNPSRFFVLPIGVVGMVALTNLAGCSGKQGPQGPPPAMAVKVVQVTNQPISDWSEYVSMLK